jgi:dihydrolipoamide dehydrogenase
MGVKVVADVVIVGGGPGGYVAAIRAAQLGKSVVVVEREHLGGICLNWGCIPTKALLRSADLYNELHNAAHFGLSLTEPGFDYAKVVERSRTIANRLAGGVAHLLKKGRVRVIEGSARFTSKRSLGVFDGEGARIAIVEGEHVVLATGARARDFPGMRINGKTIIGARDALGLTAVPQRLAILGGGSIGVEFAHLFASFGCEVHIFEALPRLLPAADAEQSKELLRSFKKRRLKVHTGTAVQSVELEGDGVRLAFERKGRPESLLVDKLLMAVGVVPNSEGLGLEEAGVETDNGWVKTDEYYRTSASEVYAVGDVIGQPCLAHVASAEGIVAVEHLCGKDVIPIDYDNIPACTYSTPQVASVGLTEEVARERYDDVLVGKFPLVANGKALVHGDTTGFVKAIVHGEDGRLLGVHIVGVEATELLLEFTLGRSMGATAKNLLRAIHPHPTLGESLHEAVAAALGEAIHL